MKKTLAIALALVCCLGLLAACGESASDPSEAPASEAPASEAPASEAPASEAPASEAPSSEPIELSGTIVVNGSTSMGDVINALTEGFNEINPKVQISYTGSGSSAGIEAVLAGSCDLGLSSRELSDDELSQGAVANVIAKDGVAVVVNPANPVTELTSEQIAKIFTGEITNWSELGGEDAEIAVFGRDAASGTRSAFEEILGIEDKCAYLNEYSSTGDVIGNVASNPNAIGYASLSAVKDSVKALTVGGVAPSEETVLDGTYTIQRPFVLATRTGEALSEAAQAFFDFATSADANEIIAAAGAVPVAK